MQQDTTRDTTRSAARKLVVETVEQAYEALESYDPALTKRALRVLVDAADPEALARVLPLTQHPEAAIRFVAKRAVRELQSLVSAPVAPAAAPTRAPLSTLPPPRTERVPLAQAVGAEDATNPWNLDPRVQRLLDAPLRRRESRPRDGGVPLRWFDMEL